MSAKTISIRGAREHNLRGIDVDIPRDKLVVITGLSGSGKSTLAFDTIFAEGQRKYMESLSAYARQFLDQLQKPDVESIEGLPPTIAIEQRSASHNPRSTVATTTEIYDYLRLLFARVGQPRCWHVAEEGPREKGPGHSRENGAKTKATSTKYGDNENGPSAGPSALSPGPSARVCGKPITAQSATQIIDHVMALPDGTRLMLLAPLVRGKKGHHKEIFEAMIRQGFVRARVNGEILDIRQGSAIPKLGRYEAHNIEAVVDRIVMKSDDKEGAIRTRVADAVELSLKLAEGLLVVSTQSGEAALAGAPTAIAVSQATTLKAQASSWTDTLFSNKHACPLHPECSLEDLEPRLFSFNSPHGACPSCGGLGTIMEFDPALVVPDENLSITEGAVDAWRHHGKRMTIWYSQILRRFCRDFAIDPQSPYKAIAKPVQRILMHGTNEKDVEKYGYQFEGVIPNLQRRFESTESEWVKAKLHGYLSEAPCETCRGARLRKEAMNVFIEEEGSGKRAQGPADAEKGKRDGAKSIGSSLLGPAPSSLGPTQLNIAGVTALTIDRAADFFSRLRLSEEQQRIAAPILKEVAARLGFMRSVGLGYLSLDRATGTLSGGEGQRIRLATQVGSGLVGCCYVLDEPTIGLHQRDNDRLIRTLRHLTDIGNTVIVVEHDEDTIRAADYVIDIGPGPGRHGGQVIAAGTLDDVLRVPDSLTAQFLSGRRTITIPAQRRTLDHQRPIKVIGARENNLKAVDIEFPLGGIVCVTGVSGSGKSTLVNQILLRGAMRELHGSKDKPGLHDKMQNLNRIDRIIEVDQSPIGRTPRSNPATYTGVFDQVRDLFSKTKEARIRGYKPGRFSFNVKGGRCEACEGQGTKKIEMHFLPDVFVVCEVCKGKRYNRETIEIHYRGKSIAEVLEMTCEDAQVFFENFPELQRMLGALSDVGLGYVQLGQASTTLSGGEAQRVKLATELGKRPTGHTLYVLDEPTTGLHFADIEKLLSVMHRLADAGNTIVVIEHNLDVIKCADWIIDLGPEGGEHGGRIVATGTPETIAAQEDSYTGQHLRKHLTPVAVGA